MTYNSGNTILGSDVADRFWNDYFAAQIDTAQSFTNSGANAPGTLGPSGNVPSGKFTVQTWYWQQEVVPRFSNAPNQARGSQPARALTGTNFTGACIAGFPTGTIKGGPSSVGGNFMYTLRIEVDRFASFVTSFRWTSYRTLQTYGPAGQGTVFDQTVKRYKTSNDFLISSPTNPAASGDSITTSEFDAAFNVLAQAYATQRNAASHTQATNYTICHNSCHTSCHRNRGRR